MDRLARYRDVVGEVKAFLSARIETALAAGISRDRIAVDPGIGFAKNATHNLTLLARIDEIVALGFPVVVGVSRKRFLGRLLERSDRRAARGDGGRRRCSPWPAGPVSFAFTTSRRWRARFASPRRSGRSLARDRQ